MGCEQSISWLKVLADPEKLKTVERSAIDQTSGGMHRINNGLRSKDPKMDARHLRKNWELIVLTCAGRFGRTESKPPNISDFTWAKMSQHVGISCKGMSNCCSCFHLQCKNKTSTFFAVGMTAFYAKCLCGNLVSFPFVKLSSHLYTLETHMIFC